MLPYMTKETADVINNFEAGRLYEKALKAITSEPIKEAEEDLTQKEGKMNVGGTHTSEFQQRRRCTHMTFILIGV